jgi:hypothetical protein
LVGWLVVVVIVVVVLVFVLTPSLPGKLLTFVGVFTKV